MYQRVNHLLCCWWNPSGNSLQAIFSDTVFWRQPIGSELDPIEFKVKCHCESPSNPWHPMKSHENPSNPTTHDGSMYAIYGNIYHQYTPNTPVMLANIYHTWILWAIINPIKINVFPWTKTSQNTVPDIFRNRGDGAALCVSPKPGLHHGTLPALRLSEHRGARWVPGLPGHRCIPMVILMV